MSHHQQQAASIIIARTVHRDGGVADCAGLVLLDLTNLEKLPRFLTKKAATCAASRSFLLVAFVNSRKMNHSNFIFSHPQ
jgi:hypothetical protein